MRWDGERLYLEMTGIEEYLGVGVEIQCNGNFLQTIKMILMRTPSSGGCGELL